MKNIKKSRKLSNILRYVLIPGLSIIIIIVILNIFIYKLELTFFYNIYENEVAGTTSLISRRLQSALFSADGTAAFFASSEDVTKEEFDSFASALTKNITSGVIKISTMIAWSDAQNIIRYAYPSGENDPQIIGLDQNKYRNRLETIIKAKSTKSVAVSEPIIFVGGYPGILFYSPIFKGSDYLGSISVAVRFADLLSPIPGENSIYNKNQYIQTDNFIIPFNEDVIFDNNGKRIVNSQGDSIEDPAAKEYSNIKEYMESRDIVFADKTWQLKFSQTYTQEVNKRMLIYSGLSLIFVLSAIILLWILQKREQRLSEEVAKTKALIFSVGDGLMALDKNGIITFFNKKAAEISGYGTEDLLNKPYYNFLVLTDSKGVVISQKERPYRQAMIKKEVVNISMTDHLYSLKKDGKRFPISSTIAPIIVDGEIDGSIMTFRDITKESEIDKMKTEFLSLASHQLLTPSSAIKWLSELLLNGDFGKLKQKQRKSIQSIYNSNENIIGLINSLLNISRIESGRIIVDPKPTYLADIANKIAEELKNKIQEKGQTFSIKSEKGLPKINIDPRLIGEVYKNLLTNAIKYTPAKGNISITIGKTEKNIISKVSDNGYGIPEKDRNRVFEKFYRGENITKIEKDGNGLGLYLVKQIIEVSGGKIWFESEINKGTTFWFSLPVSGSNPKAGEVTIG